MLCKLLLGTELGAVVESSVYPSVAELSILDEKSEAVSLSELGVKLFSMIVCSPPDLVLASELLKTELAPAALLV